MSDQIALRPDVLEPVSASLLHARRGPLAAAPASPGIKQMFASLTPPRTTVSELATANVLLTAKAMLGMLGLHALADAGAVTFDRHHVFSRPGLLISSSSVHLSGATPIPVPVPSHAQFLSVPAWDQREAEVAGFIETVFRPR